MRFTLLTLAAGMAGGLLLAWSALGWARSPGRVLAASLVVASSAYVVFAVAAAAGPRWILLEVLGTFAFGGTAVAGLRHSPIWLAVAWAAHPLWDVPLHYIGSGAAFAPSWYALACVPFDWVVALLFVRAARRRASLPFPGRTTARTPRPPTSNAGLPNVEPPGVASRIEHTPEPRG